MPCEKGIKQIQRVEWCPCFCALGVEAPTLLSPLLDGLLWRARKTVQGQHTGMHFVVFFNMSLDRVHDVSMKFGTWHLSLLLNLDCIARLTTGSS